MSATRLQTSPEPDSAQPRRADPSDANTDWDWISETLAKIGTAVIAVSFKGADIDEVLRRAGPGFEEKLGEELTAHNCGIFDSLRRADPFICFFYCSEDVVGKAANLITLRLKSLQILKFAAVCVADPHERIWRQLHAGPIDASQL